MADHVEGRGRDHVGRRPPGRWRAELVIVAVTSIARESRAARRVEQGDVAGAGGNADDRAGAADRVDAAAVLGVMSPAWRQPASRARASRAASAELHWAGSFDAGDRQRVIGSALQGCKRCAYMACTMTESPILLQGPDRRPARLLRRRRPRDPDRRAGARAVRRARLCPPRDRPQPLRRRPAARAGRGVRR